MIKLKIIFKNNKFLFRFVALLILLLVWKTADAQHFGIKTNTLYLATTTPNIGFEAALSKKVTLSFTSAYNPFSFPSRVNDEGRTIHPHLRHWLIMPEIKYWFCKSFQRANLGLHAIYGKYNFGGIPISNSLKDYRYQGDAVGGGISYGYQWAVGERWGLEASLGVGYLHMNYKKYECAECGDFVDKLTRNYVGPTKAALSLIYYLK